MAQGHRFRYSRWDGTQVGFELGADDVFSQLTDDLLYHGDPDAALRRMLHTGFRDRAGQQVEGIRDLMDKLRERRREMLQQHDLGGAFDDIAEQLRDVVDTERRALDELAREAEQSGDARRSEVTDAAVQDRQMELDLLPPDLAGMVRELQNYDFTSSEARERFEGLLDQLRNQLTQRYVDQMSGAVQNMSPADMARMKDMLAELNRMLDQRANGEEPDFAGFMERYGDFFPENPQTLDELLEVMAQRMAAMSSMMASMTPEQRAQIQALSDQLLEDLDLRWEVDQLGQNLRGLFPQMGWDRAREMTGNDPLNFAEATEVFDELGDLDQLEQVLRGASSPGALAEVDLEKVRDLLGPDSAQSLEKLQELTRMLTEAGLIEQREGRLELTPAGLRRIGANALSELFRKLDHDRIGRHEMSRLGAGHERTFETKAYEYGDAFNLDIGTTVRNAIRRTGGGTPVELSPEDFEVERTEHVVRAATVLLVDLSLSMPMRDNFLAAKKVAMALFSLISGQYPRDYLGIVGFSRVARVVTPDALPEVSWDYDYGTNMQHGLLLARRLLARESGTKQVIMITDGEPTAHITASGDVTFNYPPTRATVDATLTEVARCTREQVRINTFMLDATPHLQWFVEQMTKMNRGRAFFTTPETLGDYVLVDFLEQRRAMSHGR